jgi:hypothetical protein
LKDSFALLSLLDTEFRERTNKEKMFEEGVLWSD